MKLRKKLFIAQALMGSIIFTSCHGTLVPKTTAIIPVIPTDATGTGDMPAYVLDTPINPIDFSDVDVNANYEIDFWDKNDDNVSQVKVFTDAIEEFEKLYPNITVNIKHYTDYGRLYQDVIKNIQTKSTPNIAISYPDHAAVYSQNSSILIKMQDLINSTDYPLGSDKLKFEGTNFDNIVSKFYDEGKVIDVNSSDGYHYDLNYWTMPFVRSTEVLYVNKTWLDEHNFEIPENGVFSWDYIWEICRYAKENDETIECPFLYQAKDNCIITMMQQCGYPYTSEWGEILFNNEQNKALIKKIDALNSEGLFTVKDAIGKYPSFYLNTGKEIFAIDSSAGSTWIGTNCPVREKTDESTSYEYELYITTIPQEDVNNPTAISQGPSICIFNKENKGEVWASWLFLQYLLTDKVQLGFSRTEGYIPVTKSALASDEFKSLLDGSAKITYNKNVGEVSIYKGHQDALNVVYKYIDSTFIAPPSAKSAGARSAVAEIIYGATIGPTLWSDGEIESKFKQAVKKC